MRLGIALALCSAVARAATTFPANTAVAHVDFSRLTSNLYVVSERIQYARMETDILAWSSARVRGAGCLHGQSVLVWGLGWAGCRCSACAVCFSKLNAPSSCPPCGSAGLPATHRCACVDFFACGGGGGVRTVVEGSPTAVFLFQVSALCRPWSPLWATTTPTMQRRGYD
jgi:hypothetical protein